MGITNRWWNFTEGMVNLDHDQPGVYELGDAAGTVVYVGSSNQIRRRLLEHLAEQGTCIKRNATLYRIEYTPYYVTRERQLYDEFVRAYGRQPRCNSIRP
jgi:predicted GIY-YIG superfamily endonuclease